MGSIKDIASKRSLNRDKTAAAMEAFEANNVGNLINILELVPKVLVYTL